MYKGKLWTIDECKTELRYLESINPTAPGETFNYRRDCFAEYCNSQANHVLASGFRLIAQDMLQIRDCADIDYRSKAREKGHYVCGVWVTRDADAWLDICRASETA